MLYDSDCMKSPVGQDEETTSGYRTSFQGNESILKLTSGYGDQFCEHTKHY